MTITLSDTEIEKIAKFLDAQEGASVDGPIPEASEVNGIFRNALIGALRKRVPRSLTEAVECIVAHAP